MQTVPFDPLNFCASNGAQWLVREQDQITYEFDYDPVKGLMVINYVIGNTNVSGFPVALRMKLPMNLPPLRRVEPLQYFTDGNEVKDVGYADINPLNGPEMRFYKFDLSPWKPTAGHNTAIHGCAMYSV